MIHFYLKRRFTNWCFGFGDSIFYFRDHSLSRYFWTSFSWGITCDWRKITIYGRSLGCTFAVKTATLNQSKQLILEAPFYNLLDVTKYHYPFLPFKFLLRYKFNSNELISKVNCNTTIFHGTEDNVVPYSSGKKLFEKSNKMQTSFVTIKNGTHHNLAEFKKYQETISKILNW